MKIQLDEKWTIESDSRCWSLLYESPGEGRPNPKTGEPGIARDASYHARLQDALLYYLEQNMRPATNLSAILDRIAEAEKNITTACAGITRDAALKSACVEQKK